MIENAKLWVEELKSGKYVQTTCHLGGESKGYCCLGVACKVYEEVTGNVLPKDKYGKYLEVGEDEEGNYEIHDSLTGPYVEVKVWLGLKHKEGLLPFDHEYNSLTSLNDSGRYSFDEIANNIVEHEDYLFVRDKDAEQQ
jgi:hypothetical protein